MTARALVLALTLALPGLAAAQDAAPVISHVELNGKEATKVAPGHAVSLVGSGFPADALDGSHPGGLEVTLGGQSVMILNAQTNAVTVLIPFDMPTGRLPFRVTVAGRGSAEVMVDVVGQRRRPTEEPRRRLEPDEEDRLLAAFRITRFVLLRDAPGARLEAEGTVPDAIPNGFVVSVFLSLGDREVDAQRVSVRDHAWRATFGPYAGELPTGSYSLNFLFELAKQPRLLARRFADQAGPGKREVYDLVFRKQLLGVGTDEEAAAQRARIQNHQLELDAAIERLVRDLEAELWAVPFNPAHYEGWAKQRFLPALAAARAGQRAFQIRSAFPLEPAADERSARALDVCDLLLRAWSRDLYAGANLPVPDLLVAPTDLPPTKDLRIELEAARLGALRAAGVERP